MIKTVHHVSAKLSGSLKQGFSGTREHKVTVTVTGKRDLLRLSEVVAEIASEERRPGLSDLSRNLKIATRFSITMTADQWQPIERQMLTNRK